MSTLLPARDSAMDCLSREGGENINDRHIQTPTRLGGGGGGEEDSLQDIKNSRNIIISDENSDQLDSGSGFTSGLVENNQMVCPHSQLPRPEPPQGVMPRSLSLPAEPPASVSIGKFFREKSNSVSAAITRRISSLRKEDDDGDDDNDEKEEVVREFDLVGAITKRISALRKDDNEEKDIVKEFNLLGLKVTKTLKQEQRKELKGRVTFFSRSNCRDCGAVRSFLRERNLSFVEINVEVYPRRQKELIERTGGAAVPQIFFNEKLIGGLVALNSLRNSGMLEGKLEEILGRKCPEDAPAAPVYGFEDEDEVEEEVDEMAGIVRVVRQRVPIRDRVTKMKFVKNCFSGAELVEAIIHHLDCGRRKAVEIGKQLAKKHFIHHVFGENDFEDGNHFYRLLEHESFIQKCHNFRGTVNDSEPKAAAVVSLRLACLLSAILESYASDDRRFLDYIGISNSEEFRRYVNLVEDLQRVDLHTLSADEKLAFFLNLHNGMAIHAVIRIGPPGGMIDRSSFFADFMYVVGGYPYSLSSIKNGILRSNRRPPFSLIKPFSGSDKRLQLAFPKVNQLLHFGMWSATRGSPSIRFFSPQGIECELRNAAREYFQRDDGIRVDLAKRTVYLSRIISWYSADFGQEKQILKWMINYLDASKAGLLTHLLDDGAPINVVYQNFDWSLNSSS